MKNDVPPQPGFKANFAAGCGKIGGLDSSAAGCDTKSQRRPKSESKDK